MAQSKEQILIIDDDRVMRMLATTILERAGYEVVEAVDGSDGLSKIRSRPPKMILCDIMMPAPNGFELREALNDDPRLSQIPFIFLTARGAQVDKLRGLGIGADDYIVKPFNGDELLARIKAIFRRTQLLASQRSQNASK